MKRKRRLYIADYCLTPTRRIDKCGILCEDTKILTIGSRSAFIMESELEVFEFRNAYITPGFIDTHIHGAGGFDSSLAYEENSDINVMCDILAQRGVTGFMPTVVSDKPERMLQNLTALAAMIDAPHAGAEPLGIHIGGHISYLSRACRSIDIPCPLQI